MESMRSDLLPPLLSASGEESITIHPRGYRGNNESQRNQDQPISDQENCCVWIEGLPANCTYSNLFAKLRGTGKIWAAYINSPTTFHSTAAAKVEFWNRRGVARLFDKVHSRKFRFGEYRPRVVMNRVRKGGHAKSAASRVITVKGPSSVVNTTSLSAFFGARFRYELEHTQTIHDDGEQTTMLWAFGSYRCQAKWAYQNLIDLQHCELEPDEELWGQLRVGWVVDPCE